MISYPYRISNGHHLVEMNGYTILLDTGSPINISFNPALSSLLINGLTVSFESGAMSEMLAGDKESIENLVSCKVDGILGLETMRDLGTVYLDKDDSIAAFEPVAMPSDALQIPLHLETVNMFFLQLLRLCAPANVNGTDTMLVLDTGAPINYINKDLLAGLPVVGTTTDYHPMLGDFTCNQKEAVVNFGGTAMTLPVSECPSIVLADVKGCGCDGVIGFSKIFKHKLLLDFTNMVCQVM